MDALKVFALILFAGAVCTASPSRIVGGEASSIENYPSLVQVESLSLFSDIWTQTCGGYIITNLHILSAAHCFDGWTYPSSEYRQIRAGSTYRGTGGELFAVSWARNHPTYGSDDHDGDITIVRLTTSFTFGTTIAMGSIVIQDWQVTDGSAVLHVGWGFTEQGGSPSDVLLAVSNNVVNRATCAEAYSAAPWPRSVTDNMICTGSSDGGKDACNGDEGGPLFFGGVAIGINSWGQGCAQAEYPGVSTSISAYSNWILSNAV